jgi:hypothetical protein
MTEDNNTPEVRTDRNSRSAETRASQTQNALETPVNVRRTRSTSWISIQVDS